MVGVRLLRHRDHARAATLGGPGPSAAVGVRAAGGGLRDPLARRHPLGRALRTRGRLPRRAQRRPAHHRPRHRMGHARRRTARSSPRPTSPAGGSRRTRCTSARSSIGEGARVGGRSILMPGARVGAGPWSSPARASPVDSRSGRSGPVRPRECVGIADGSWPAPGPSAARVWWTLVYTVSLFGFGWIPLLAGLPWLVLLGWAVRHDTTLEALVLHALVVAPVRHARSRSSSTRRCSRSPSGCSPGRSSRASTRSTAAPAGAPGWSRAWSTAPARRCSRSTPG